NIEKEIQSTEILKVDDFKDLNLPEKLLPYTGIGATSFAEYDKKSDPNNWKNQDTQKREYMESLDIYTPEEWLIMDEETGQTRIEQDKRALFITMFILTGHILATESIRRVGGSIEDFQEVLNDRNVQIMKHRLDEYGMRRVLGDGSTVESHYEKLKLSSNPEKRVSMEELMSIKEYIFEQLRK
nr:hypothetical protein [Candidatus Dojkabacteria bacterium]